MSYATALTELNDSIDDYFGETVSYTPAAGGAATTGITAVIDYLDVEGQAMLDLPTASIASPTVGSLITLSDATTFRIYDYGNKRRGYTPCDIRSTDYWRSSTVQSSSDGRTFATFGSLTLFPLYLDEGTAVETFDGDTAGVDRIYSGRCRYLSTITEKMRFAVGSDYYYVTGVKPDASSARWLDLDLVKRSF